MFVTSSSELLRRIFFLQRPHLLNNKTRIARSASRNIKDSPCATLQTFPGYSKCVWPCNNTCIVSKSNAEFEKLQIVPLPFISAVSALPFMFLCQIKNLKYNIRTNLIRMATKCFLSQQKSRIKALYGNSDPFSR